MFDLPEDLMLGIFIALTTVCVVGTVKFKDWIFFSFLPSLLYETGFYLFVSDMNIETRVLWGRGGVLCLSISLGVYLVWRFYCLMRGENWNSKGHHC